ncbi:hypothetical protein [uncultured Corynebacterium sp.]|nr:hypothetical protein [uncultured Corynebacterium sp.]
MAYRVRCTRRGATAQVRPTTTRFLPPTSPRRASLAGPAARNLHPQSRA